MVLENFLAFGFQNLVLIDMLLASPNTNITGVVLVIDVIKVANELFTMADLMTMGFRTTGDTIEIAMLLQVFLKNCIFWGVTMYSIIVVESR